MHWFDRMSKQFAAARPTTTRRSMLRGTAVAVAVAPFAPGALTYAKNKVIQLDNTESCVNCLIITARRNQDRIDRCKGETPNAGSRLQLKPKRGGGGKGTKGGKGKKGMKPTEGAKRAACMSQSAATFLEESRTCLRIDCGGLGENSPKPIVIPPGQSPTACPPGTSMCAGTLCCYGDDKCCSCPTLPELGAICCAAVIGCSCC
jgi:hypothetical protein